MTGSNVLFTSESVTEGHPDKIADQISDRVLDACLEQDIKSRVACETLVTTGLVVVVGEITTNAVLDIQKLVRTTVEQIGYNDSAIGFDWKSCAVLSSLHKQSSDIAMGVDERKDHEQGAGDQGMMFGYACRETGELMPMPITFAHRLTRRLAEIRKSGDCKFIRPDGKAQVTVHYMDQKPVSVETVVVSTQHTEDVRRETLREAVMEEVIKKVIPNELLTPRTKYHINPTGNFVIGGPHGDAGLTGRKIIVDTYGGMGRHGGGAFSGKDPSKVDRSACYMARYIAKNIVAAGIAERCEVQLAYAIGVAEPVSIMVETYGTSKISSDRLANVVREVFSVKPAGIIHSLNLLRPIYRKTSTYGHFGRTEPEFTWERTDKVEELKKLLS